VSRGENVVSHIGIRIQAIKNSYRGRIVDRKDDFHFKPERKRFH